MAEDSTNRPISVDIGIQTDVFQQEFSSSDSSTGKLTPDATADVSDSGSSYDKLRSLFAQDGNDDNDGISSNCETDFPYSSCSSCTNTRRNSIISDSDLEIPMHILFGSPVVTPSVTSTSNLESPPHALSSSATSSTTSILEGVDVHLRRLICERFLELRRIQLGERAVSGGHARQNLETFFYRAIHGPTEEERLQQESQNRPIHVVNDVNQLRQQSLVQSALQNDFRTQLERTLQAGVQSTTNRSTGGRVQAIVPTSTSRVGGSQFRSQLESLLSDRTSQIQPQMRRVQNNSASRSQPNIRTPGLIPPPPPVESNNMTHQPQTANLQSTLEAGMQLLTDSITEDLNRLQSLQVVSNMLRTDFRNELEHMVQDRVANVGNGETVENFIRSLPHSTNSAQRVHHHRHLQEASDRNVASEIHSLRQQLDEMKQMMTMSIEIQMDTQRAIRQEVAAVFTTFMQDYLAPQGGAGNASNPTAFYPRRSHPVSSGQCVICIDRNIDTVLYQCGHMCVCITCGLQLKIDGHNCPMCRAPIRDVVRAYQTH